MLCVARRVHADVEYQVAAWFLCIKDRKKILKGGGDKQVGWLAHPPVLWIFGRTLGAIVFSKFETELYIANEPPITVSH